MPVLKLKSNLETLLPAENKATSAFTMDSVLREGYIVGDYVDYRGKVYLIEGFRKILRQASLKELSNNEDRKYPIVRK